MKPIFTLILITFLLFPAISSATTTASTTEAIAQLQQQLTKITELLTSLTRLLSSLKQYDQQNGTQRYNQFMNQPYSGGGFSGGSQGGAFGGSQQPQTFGGAISGLLSSLAGSLGGQTGLGVAGTGFTPPASQQTGTGSQGGITPGRQTGSVGGTGFDQNPSSTGNPVGADGQMIPTDEQGFRQWLKKWVGRNQPNDQVPVNKVPCPDGVRFQDYTSPQGVKGCTSVGGFPPCAGNNCVGFFLRAIRDKCRDCTIEVTGGTELGHETHGVGKPIFDLSDNYEVTNSIIREHFSQCKYETESRYSTAPHWHCNLR